MYRRIALNGTAGLFRADRLPKAESLTTGCRVYNLSPFARACFRLRQHAPAAVREEGLQPSTRAPSQVEGALFLEVHIRYSRTCILHS